MKQLLRYCFLRILLATFVGFVFRLVALMILAHKLPVQKLGSIWIQLPMSIITIVVPILTYSLLSRWSGVEIRLDEQTRCRHCKYILHGLSEPRCPECGEPI